MKTQIMRKIIKVASHPKRYITLLFKEFHKQSCSLFQNSSFFMQGQMDINPKSLWHNQDFKDETGGFYLKSDQIDRQVCNLEPWDNTRRDMLVLLLRVVVEKEIEGDLAEVGVYKGHTAKLIHYYLPERVFHLFDTFEGFTDRSVASERKNTNLKISPSHFADTSLALVKKNISQKNENINFYVGYFPESIPSNLHESKFAFVHLDADLYQPILEGLTFFYSRMSCRGMIVVHDYNAWPGARKAVDDFFSDKPEVPIPMPDKSGSALIIKQ